MTYVQQWRVRIARLRHDNMITLLVLLVIEVFVAQFISTPGGAVERIVQDVLFSLILLNGVVAAADRPRAFVLIAMVALIAIVVRWAGWLFPVSLTLAMRGETALVAFAVVSVTIGLEAFGAGTVMVTRICGAIALYILLGLIWTEAYELVSLRVPGAFSGIQHGEDPADRSIWIYFSFVTLTTEGYGDIVPIARAARSLANLEALFGQLYPAIVLARLVSLQDEGRDSGPWRD
jgi:hypothetical protein